ncbi:MAG: ankyrin repeat domain-containing protein [Chlamydiia bacterium]|nr:ankyrin repeat domain-containing protein [Chlamydiia bacterium]
MTQQLSPINPALRASTVKKSPETLTDLPDEMLEAIFSFLSRSQLIGVALVNKRFKDITQSVMKKQARESGYKGDDYSDAMKYLDSFRILALKGPLSEYQVKDEKSEIDCVATFKRFQHEKKTNLQDKLNKSLTSLWENLSEEKDEVVLLIEAFLTCGADSNLKNQFADETILFSAARIGYNRIAALLVEHGANMEAANNNHERPLHLAAFSPFGKKVTAILLAHGAEINARGLLGRTPLHWAVFSANKDVVALLLNHGAKVDVQDNLGRTPLFLAAEQGKNGIVVLLIKKGANVDTAYAPGCKPIDIAFKNKHFQVCTSILLLTPNRDPRRNHYRCAGFHTKFQYTT